MKCVKSNTYSNKIKCQASAQMLKNKTLPCILYSTCPTVNENKHLSCLNYGRGPTKGCNYVGTCLLPWLVRYWSNVLCPESPASANDMPSTAPDMIK